ncbi:hypothetical protein FOZ62_006286, partial [Perkinsus olseni]
EALTIGPGGPARFVTDREVSPACEGLQASTIPKCHACEFLCKPFRPASGHEVADGGVCIDTLSPHVRDGLELFGSHLESHCSLLNEYFDDTSSK